VRKVARKASNTRVDVSALENTFEMCQSYGFANTFWFIARRLIGSDSALKRATCADVKISMIRSVFYYYA
jgi:hypothetical protein